MKLEEAINKAEAPMQASDGTQDAYTIPFELAEYVKSLIGKNIGSADPKNTNVLEIVQWIGQNYILRNGDNYTVSPVMWVISNLNAKRVKII